MNTPTLQGFTSALSRIAFDTKDETREEARPPFRRMDSPRNVSPPLALSETLT